MAIKYYDHLHDASSQTLLASSALLSPRSIGTPKDLTFKYVVSYKEDDINKQSVAFVNSIRGNHHFTQSLDRFISLPFNERDQAIKDVYKYSIFKVLSAMEDLVDNGFNYYGAVPSNSLVFYGHKMLFYTFLNYNIFNPALDLTSNVYMTRILEIDIESFKEMRNDDVWKNSYNANYPGGLYNRNYERILNALLEMSGIEVSSLSSQNDIPMDSRLFSLGSMAYTFKAKSNIFSSMEDSIATVSTQDSITDHNSKFWNIACGISISELPEENTRPDYGTPYTYVRKRMVSTNTVFAEVESITGLKAEGLYSNYGRFVPGIGKAPLSPNPNGGNPSFPSGNSTNYPLNGGNGNNNPIYGGNGPNFNPDGSSSNGGSNNKQQNKKIKSFVKNKAHQIGRSLTSDEVKAFIKDAAINLLSNELSKRRERDLIDDLKNIGYVEDSRSASFEAPFARLEWKKKGGRFNQNE
jgi:hypothetical protein